MSLPTKVVPKSATVAVSGPGSGPSPSNQLRATLTSVSLPPGAPVAPQPAAGLPPQIPRVQQSIDERIFSQPGVTAVYTIPRHAGPQYAAHDITKGHPSLACTPPGHPHSAALSQVSVATASPYRYPKGWETGPGSPYNPGQNACSAPLVYSTQTQPMNAQPQSRPFATGPRPTHHQGGFRPVQFFQRTQMQAARPTLPANTPSLRPGSQNPTGPVYSQSQPIMMTMAPMPFPSPQAAQYYIPQYRHSTPYVGPPQQYTVQPPGTGAFYPAPGHGDFPTPYLPTPQQPPPAKREKKTIRIRDPNQGGRDITEEIMSGGSGSRNPTPPVIGRPSSTPTPPQKSSSPSPVHPDPAVKRRDASALVSIPAPPAETPELPSPTPTAVPPAAASLPLAAAANGGEKLSTMEPSSSPAAPLPSPSPSPSATESTVPLAPPQTQSPKEPKALLAAPPQTPNTDKPLPELPRALATPPVQAPKALNGLTDPLAQPHAPAQEPSPLAPALLQPQASTSTLAFKEVSHEPLATEKRPVVVIASPGAHVALKTPVAVVPVTLSSASAPVKSMPAPPPGLPPLVQATAEAGEPSKPVDTKALPLKVGMESHIGLADGKAGSQPQAFTRKSPTTGQTSSATPKSWRKPNEVPVGEAPQKDSKEEPRSVEQTAATEQTTQKSSLQSTTTATAATTTTSSRPAALLPTPNFPPTIPGLLQVRESPALAPTAPPEENGEAEPEPMRNGAGHASETESSDSGSAPGDKESSGAPDMEDLAETNGKRQYNREYLLRFQFMPACIQKPEGLPPISDVVLDKINQNKLPSRAVEPRVVSRGPDFTPAFADFGRQMTGGRGSPMVNMGARRPPPRKIIMNVSDDVQLKKSENAWKPGLKREAVGEEPDVNQTQELFRKVRSILNKLTPQMFNQLMKQVTDLTIDTEERLKGVIDLVFEKAIDEPGFSVAYGNMCRCLATLKVPMTDKPNTTVNFRKLLLNRCQKEFEKDKVDDVVFERKQKELDSAASTTERERLQEELEEAKDKARRRSIGNIKFIGELFKLKMLTEAIMHDCVVKLLKNHDEESLECLCRLLTTIGKDLDFAKAKPRMDQYFRQMEKIVKERKTSSRIRFMLQDIIDLRLHDWVSRRADQGPKTIEQIHKEAKIEEQEEQRKVHQQLLNKDTKRRPDPREQREQREPRAPREETWNTVPMTKNSRTIDPTKIMKISKPQMDEKIQLGPRVSWIKGSSGGAKASDSELSRSGGSSLNRYSALQPSPSPQASTTPAQNTDYDSRRALGSRSTGRERSDKTLSPAPSSWPGPFSRGGSSKDLLEGPEELQEKEVEEPRRPSITEEKTEPERTRAKEPVKPELVAPGPDGPILPEEEMERKSKSIIDEFLHINDLKEAVQCVEELKQPSQLQVFVRVGVESTLERSQMARQHMGQLFFRLLQQGVLSKAQLCSGFADILEQADDMAIDIPHIWLYLAELLSPVLSEGGFSMRELFSELSKPLLPVGRAGMLFSEILHILCKNMSHSKVGALWRESGLGWSQFLSEGEDVQEFITQQKLPFTQSEGCSLDAATPESTLPTEELSRQLDRLLREDMATDEQVFDWVEANLDESQMSSSPFLRALMTAVCKAAVKDESSTCRVDTAIIQRRLPVLLKYLNSDTERQLQALYALQALIVTLDQPPNLLRMFFDCLYDEDVISEDAFYRWESSTDPAEQQGKGVALKSVTAFFTWLREAEEESEDN
ncbi:unnamed protein product [Lota lota]